MKDENVQKEKKRQQLSDVLDITISTSRVNSYLKEYTRKNNESPRISAAAPVVLAVASNWALEGCIETLFEAAVDGDVKVSMELLARVELPTKPWWPLFRTTMEFESETTDAVDDDCQEADQQNSSLLEFMSNINDAIKAAKRSKPDYAKVRILKSTRMALNEVLKQFMRRLSLGASIILKQQKIQHKTARTLSETHITSVLELWMCDENQSAEGLMNYIDEKLRLFRAHQKAARKDVKKELDPELKKEHDIKALQRAEQQKEKLEKTIHDLKCQCANDVV